MIEHRNWFKLFEEALLLMYDRIPNFQHNIKLNFYITNGGSHFSVVSTHEVRFQSVVDIVQTYQKNKLCQIN